MYTLSHIIILADTQNDVWVFMELMATCLDRLLKKLKSPFPEEIVCKMTVSVSTLAIFIVVCRVSSLPR